MSELANQVIKSFALSGFLPGKPDQSQQAGAEEPDGGGYRNRIDLNSNSTELFLNESNWKRNKIVLSQASERRRTRMPGSGV
jgi:hypothetical protein